MINVSGELVVKFSITPLGHNLIATLNIFYLLHSNILSRNRKWEEVMIGRYMGGLTD